MPRADRSRVAAIAALLALVVVGVWALVPLFSVQEPPESIADAANRAPQPVIDTKPGELAQEPDRLPPPTTDTGARHSEYHAAKQAFDPSAVADVPISTTPLTRSPVVVFDQPLTSDLTQYLPDISILVAALPGEEGDPELLWFGNYSVPSEGITLNMTSVSSGTDWLGTFLAGAGGECRWHAAETMWVVEDAFGSHPVLVDRGTGEWESVLPAPFYGVSSERLIDWRAIPARGDQFDRQWQSQLHLNKSPSRDGIIFRYEGGHRYLPRTQRGRGNSAHHWNLLAYAINEIPETAVSEQLSSQKCIGDLIQGVFPHEWVEQYRDWFSEQWYQEASETKD